jgi:multidrug efflux pump subunit AcrB/ABC-type multidrug transport system ATPase subunit
MNMILHRKTTISMLFLGLSLLGVISYKNLQVELYPNAEFPYLFVQVMSAIEMDPEYVENQAIIPLEGAIGTLEGIESIESTVSPRQSMIIVSYKPNVNFKYAFLKLQEKVNSVKTSLPENFIINVSKVDLESLSNQFMELQVRGGGDLNRVRTLVDQKILSELENIDGIASARVFGGQEKSIEIRLDLDACEAYDITPSEIQAAIQRNALDKTFVGYAFESGTRYFVNVSAEYNDITEIENVVVANGPILLKDVAEIFFGVKDETSFSRVNGKNAVTVLLVNDAQANLIDLSHTTKEAIARINEKYESQDLEIVIQSNVAESMENNIHQIINLALIGGLLAVCVLWVFLKNLRIVSIVALAIPISVLAAFNFFYATGITINSLTLVGIALAVGMLLDNSVVVLENIYRLATGKGHADQAVIQGTREVWRAIMAATLTTVVIFLPFVFSSNFLIKLYGLHVGVSIVSTLLISLLVALFFIPMAVHFLLSRRKDRNIFFEKVTTNNRIIQIYILVLKACMRYPARTIIGVVVVFFIAVFAALSVSVNTLSEPETSEFRLYVTMPTGSNLESTDKVVQKVEEQLESLEEKEDIISQVQEEEAIITVKLQEEFEKIADRSLEDIQEGVEEQMEEIANAEISLTQPTSGGSFRGPSNNPVQSFERLLGMGSSSERIVIKGDDFEVMEGVAEDLRYYIDELESIQRVSVSISSNQPEVHLFFDQMLMTEYGITLIEVGAELGSFSREFSSGMNFKQGTEEYDIMITEGDTIQEEEEKGMEDLRTLPIADQTGGTHDLQTIADIVYADGMRSINRVDQEKQIEVNYAFISEAEESKDLLEAYRIEIDEIIARYNLPSGVAVEVIHEENELRDFYFLIGAAFILIFMILASVFESVSTPFVLMFSIPLAAMGSFLALIITGNSLFNANTLTGFLILIGVVVNNSILLIDYTNILRKRGFRKTRALMVAGLSRVRPILITAITTIVAMIPLAMGQAEYVSIIGAPFAITVIGGLSLSTLFTLVFIPTFYFGLENAIAWFRELDVRIKLLQLVVVATAGYLIYTRVDAFLWQLVLTVLMVVLVPGLTWFVMTSLRRATTRLIDPSAPIVIRIQNLVKIYERDPRVVREWKGGIEIRKRAGLEKDYTRWRDFYNYIWQIPLLGFMVFFTYIYLRPNMWMFLLSIGIYLYILGLYQPLHYVFSNLHRKTNKGIYTRLDRYLKRVLYWGLPAGNLVVFYFLWDNLGVVIIVGILWLMALVVHSTSQRLYQDKVNIERISGKFGTLRRTLLRLVKQIPLIGKRRQPFKALDGVSFDIGTGMFGLLGPNGAGKSTMMRIICGILDQSYGKVWINGIDTLEKREELQGQIGYLPQEFGSYEHLTAWEYLDYQALLKGIADHNTRKERIDKVLNSVHMIDRKDEKIGSYSGGMKQRIGIAQILLHLPKILVVDEPTAGLDPRERIRFRNMLVELSRDRIVLFSTHIIEDISSSCNKVAVIDKGRVKYVGVPQDMTDLAENYVWKFKIPASEFESLDQKEMIVHHMRDGDDISVRYISGKKPHTSAVNVRPLLEDAYLCLLKDIGRKY